MSNMPTCRAASALGLCGMRKGILIDCRTTTNQPWGARRHTNGNGSHLKFQPKSGHSPEVGELIIGMLTITELRGAIFFSPAPVQYFSPGAVVLTRNQVVDFRSLDVWSGRVGERVE